MIYVMSIVGGIWLYMIVCKKPQHKNFPENMFGEHKRYGWYDIWK